MIGASVDQDAEGGSREQDPPYIFREAIGRR